MRPWLSTAWFCGSDTCSPAAPAASPIRRAIDGTRPSCGREQVKQEMLVSEADSPPQTCSGRLHDGGCPGPGRVAGDTLPGDRGARRVCVLTRRVPRGEGVRMSSEPATVTAAPGGPGLRLYRAGKAEHYAGASPSWISTT